ncbi:MAG: hypothetical protein AB9903_22315 [Vulcanimicrobiota bacterium]
MADYTDPDEANEIAELYANYPPSREITHMCRLLGIEEDNIKTIREANAWAYYHELKSMIEAQQRKTA